MAGSHPGSPRSHQPFLLRARFTARARVESETAPLWSRRLSISPLARSLVRRAMLPTRCQDIYPSDGLAVASLTAVAQIKLPPSKSPKRERRSAQSLRSRLRLALCAPGFKKKSPARFALPRSGTPISRPVADDHARGYTGCPSERKFFTHERLKVLRNPRTPIN